MGGRFWLGACGILAGFLNLRTLAVILSPGSAGSAGFEVVLGALRDRGSVPERWNRPEVPICSILEVWRWAQMKEWLLNC